jgi:hypothetical protein
MDSGNRLTASARTVCAASFTDRQGKQSGRVARRMEDAARDMDGAESLLLGEPRRRIEGGGDEAARHTAPFLQSGKRSSRHRVDRQRRRLRAIRPGARLVRLRPARLRGIGSGCVIEGKVRVDVVSAAGVGRRRKEQRGQDGHGPTGESQHCASCCPAVHVRSQRAVGRSTDDEG